MPDGTAPEHQKFASHDGSKIVGIPTNDGSIEFRLEAGQVLELDGYGPLGSNKIHIEEEDLANLEIAGTMRGLDGSMAVHMKPKAGNSQQVKQSRTGSKAALPKSRRQINALRQSDDTVGAQIEKLN